MSIKTQWNKIKDNWLIVLVLVLVAGYVLVGSPIGGITNSMKGVPYETDAAYGAPEYAPSTYRGYTDDFAPEVEDRKITKTTRLSAEVERGHFYEQEAKLKAIIQSTDSYLLNQNVNRNGEGSKSYLSGTYTIKVETDKYAAVIEQMKALGEIQYFNENTRDVTGRYTNLETDLEAEKAKLQRYQTMLVEAKSVEDKLELTDRIFNQERQIAYLEDALNSLDNRIDYSTVTMTLKEEQSAYANIVVATFASLVKSLVASFNVMLHLLFVVLPYVVLAVIILVITRLVRKARS